MLIFRIVLIIGILLVAFLVTNQILARRAGRSDLSRRQAAIRTISGITLVVILLLALVGNLTGIVFTTDVESFKQRPHLVPYVLAYACLILALAFLLLFLALLDIREVAKISMRERTEAGATLRGKDGRDQ
jgi:hypothetical protein